MTIPSVSPYEYGPFREQLQECIDAINNGVPLTPAQITGLVAATLPLAGTEVLALVQGGAMKKATAAAIANAFYAQLTQLNPGNLYAAATHALQLKSGDGVAGDGLPLRLTAGDGDGGAGGTISLSAGFGDGAPGGGVTLSGGFGSVSGDLVLQNFLHIFISGLPAADPGINNALYTDGAPGPGAPVALKISGG